MKPLSVSRTHSFLLLFFAPLVLSPASLATIIAYDAASGVLPSDSSIPPENRFLEIGAEFGFSSVNDGILTIHDTSNVNEADFLRTSPPVVSTTVASYQIEMRVLWSNRPTLNIAGDVGFVDGAKSVRLAMEPNRVGFTNRIGSALTHSLPFDTSAFHTYRVLKHGQQTIQLFIDDMTTPVLDFPYSQLSNMNSSDEIRAYLWQGSNRGRSQVEIKSFAYNPEGLVVPEPSTALLLGVAALIAMRRRRDA